MMLTDGVVVLEPHTLDDVTAHLAGEDEEQARRFGWWPNRSTEATVRRAIESWIEEWRIGGPTRAFACRVDGTLVGGCELRLHDDRSEASYYVFPDHRRRGYATRLLRLLVDWAPVRPVELHVEPDNLASLAVARNVGFRRVGELVEDGRRMHKLQIFV
jgi:RimJ/RimL family protein N-acetyltransferase